MGHDTEPVSTLIIGAGAGGLATAGVLRRLGQSFTVLERAEVIGASWRDRYDSLHLHTARSLSGLPGLPIPRRLGRWVARDDLVGYLADYARHFGIEPEFGVEVTGLERRPTGWRVITSSGSYEAANVVVATGYTHTPWLPDWPGRSTFVGELIHSSAYREPSSYAEQDVLVVGAGNSATEIAVDLLGVARSVAISVRRPPNIVRREVFGLPSQLVGIASSPLPVPIANPMSALLRRISVPDLTAFGLPAPTRGFSQFVSSQTVPVLDHGFVAAVKDRRITVVEAIESFVGDEVRLVDHTIRFPDTVIAGTGYRPNLGALLVDLDVLDDRGVPTIHGGQTRPSAPGLYVVGISVQLAGQLRQIAHEAEAIGRAVSG